LLFIIFLTIIIGFLVVFGILFIIAGLWAKNKINKLKSESEIAKTSEGKIEYVVLGEGTPLLIFHGAPGGYDQGFLMENFVENGFQVIAFSRPGYLRTPLNGHRSYNQQAKLALSLLDHLQISECVIVGLSAGGPVALRFILQYPSKVISMILMSAVTKKYIPSDYQSKSLLGKIYLSNLGGVLIGYFMSLSLRKWPERVLKSFLKLETTFPKETINELTKEISEDPDQMNWFKHLVETTIPLSARKEGLKNDIQILSELETLPLENIEKTILIVHSKNDADVEFSHAQNIMERSKNTEFYESHGLGHLVWLGLDRKQMYEKVFNFIRKYN
jgi:pimeloyl-ACP methyl ester carboxylesterase